MPEFDYVVVGAGSAGCIVAARLSEDARVSVLLVEAGGGDASPWLRVPIGYARAYYDPRVNWMYRSEPEAGLDGRRIYVPRGKVVGGSGAINAMVFVRGARRDFDDWAAAGNPGWDHESVLPLFRRMETHAAGAGPWHGGDGPIHITPMRDQAHPLTRHFLDACRQAGLPETADFNGERLEGAGVYDINTRRGLRCSSGVAYLKPALRRPNLELMRAALAQRVLFDDLRATGVAIRRGGEAIVVNARREVILCAGAVGTPKLLQLSGIGDGEMLRRNGVTPLLHAPAVGRNLQDHLCASFYYRATVPTLNDQLGTVAGQAMAALRYVLTRRGPMALSVNQAGGFFRGRADAAGPNIQLYFNPLSYRIPDSPRAGLTAEPYPGFLLAFNPCRPTSSGSVEIDGPAPEAAPLIRLNFLSTDHDADEMLQGCRLIRRIMAAPALAEITAQEMAPTADTRDDAALIDFCRRHSGSIYHLCGTARMGPDPETSVVDPTLRVHGTAGLRVVDASIFPNITSGNINAPTMMVAEKGAALIRSHLRPSL